MTAFLVVFTAVACALVLLRTESALNRMHGGTLFLVRLSFYTLAVAAGAELIAIGVYDYVPNWREALLAWGVAILLVCERRIRYLARQPRHPKKVRT